MTSRLTVDTDGHSAATPGFDAGRVRQWGYNAANDPQAIYLNYIGSAGGVFQHGDEFAFDNPDAIKAFRYLVGLINDDATPVGRVHLGVVHLFELDRPEVDPREEGLAEAGFLDIAAIRSLRPEFETWSQICIDAFLA